MDITPYIDSLRRDLVAAAETGDAQVKAAAERLAMALDPAARLALMEAISHAANEITAEMPSGSVDVRLNGRELGFVIDTPMAAPAPPPPPPPAADEVEEDGTVARITLRIPESVKARAEEKAARAGHSLNTWLVNVVRTATSDDNAINVDIDLSSLPFLGGDPFGRGPTRGKRRMTGWI
ncbi:MULTISPECIES: toxin-antitoxin system HicB family antitoxin [unclassified Nocardioides]|uniref:toxin-antitoxin system HicB family antitoxin n=1 Tax=unclassified Nocardioides TaxID=2615069 RepID=UPI0006F97160|nr:MULTISPECIES: toxin-antitoxin system HicB family antitoxin [unclassified Nocardioides]KQY57125.1 pilus assembly protein HicB [Nocardioides sp. Root140]KRF11766.1 pilus assembly protein HicB [Nocardioides sp. Soil796]